MEIRPIRTKADHRAALKEIERLMDARQGTPEGDRLEVLTLLLERGIPLFLVANGGEERRSQIGELGLTPFFRTIIVNPHKSRYPTTTVFYQGEYSSLDGCKRRV